MDTDFEFIPGGGVTSAGGFLAGAVGAGIKHEAAARLDLGLLFSEEEAATAAVFTTNKVAAAPVVLSRQRLHRGRARAVVVNSGCANASTGEPGLADAEAMAQMAAGDLGVPAEAVLVASTGVIGTRLPMERLREGLGKVVLTAEGGHELARAIMTTDTVPKEVAARSAAGFVIGGMAKGSGMIHPDMATLLGFLTTDAGASAAFLRASLKEAVDASFNMVSIDGDTSTNDMVLLMANGVAGGGALEAGSPAAAAFQRALNAVCIYLARAIARDGEGATRLIEVNVSGAASLADARAAARTIVGSPLVKAAVHGSDPNWGRVVAAAGRSGVAMDEKKLELSFGDEVLVRGGLPQSFDKEKVVRLLDGQEVIINLNLNLGGGAATAWGCDLSEEYVTINSQYTT